MSYTYKLTEEISRWAFEIHINNNPEWWIAFTNPTAGPWKRLESINSNGLKGEVYRFDRDEKRPDIVIVNDKLNAIIIFEAKDSLGKLINQTQAQKSCLVIDEMAKTLEGIKDNPFWGSRHLYKIYNGLLWGSMEEANHSEINDAFNTYSVELKNIDSVVDRSLQIGIESTKDELENIHLQFHSNSKSDETMRLLKSLQLSK